MSNGIVSIALLALNVDRLCALTWPFWARQHLTERNTRYILVGILVYVVPLNLTSLLYYSTANTTSNFAGSTCVVTTQFEEWYGVAAPIILSLSCMTGPMVVLMVLIVLVSRKVNSHSFEKVLNVLENNLYYIFRFSRSIKGSLASGTGTVEQSLAEVLQRKCTQTTRLSR